MIVNTQMSGEACWFWYASLLHGGAKLYANLHLALQPLLVLKTDVWIHLPPRVNHSDASGLQYLCLGLKACMPELRNYIVLARREMPFDGIGRDLIDVASFDKAVDDPVFGAFGIELKKNSSSRMA